MSEKYSFDETELRRRFPKDVSIPDCLIAFGHWLATQPDQSLGDFGFSSEYADYIAGPENHAHIIKFLDGDNFEAFFWRPNLETENIPIVIQDSEGQHAVVPSVSALLARIATGYYNIEFADRFYAYNFVPRRILLLEEFADYENELTPEAQQELDESPPDRREALGDWLLTQTGAASLDQLIEEDADVPDFESWMRAKDKSRAKILAAHPSVQAIHDLMTTDIAFVVWVGDHYRVVTGTKGQYVPPFRNLPEAEAIKPHAARLREEWAKTYPGLGLWFCAHFEKSDNLSEILSYVDGFLDERPLWQKIWDAFRGKKPPSIFDDEDMETGEDETPMGVTFYYDYIYPKELGDNLPEAADFKADHARYPRAAYRLSDWVLGRLEA